MGITDRVQELRATAASRAGALSAHLEDRIGEVRDRRARNTHLLALGEACHALHQNEDDADAARRRDDALAALDEIEDGTDADEGDDDGNP